MNKLRILTGDRPTGSLHLGHYVGSLQQRVELQSQYETYIIIADLHTLTTKPKPENMAENIKDLLLANLSVGLDPNRTTFFLQSQIPEISELAIILGNLVSISRVERDPTIKEVVKDLKIESPSFGLIGYPVLQTADVLSFKAHCVPVGEDNVAHLEISREIAKRFNQIFGDFFPIPTIKITKTARLVGTDGKAKMSKSLGNTINLFDSKEEVRQKVMNIYTDPNRIHSTDPGKVEDNPVFIYHDAFNKNKEEVEDLKKRYQTGKVGDVEVKEKLFIALEKFLEPIRDKKLTFSDEKLKEILSAGTNQSRRLVQNTLKEVKERMQLSLL